MATLGETLYAARNAREETLEDVARVLRIRPSILQALETGETSALPSGAVTKGFVRTYAKYLGLDDDQAVRLFEAETGPKAGTSQLVFPEIVEPARQPGWGTVLAGVLIFIIAVTSWFTYSNRDALGIERVSELPDRLIKLIKGEPEGVNAGGAPQPSGTAPSETLPSGTLANAQPAPATMEANEPSLEGENIPPDQSNPEDGTSLATVATVPELMASALPDASDLSGPVIIAVLPPLNGSTPGVNGTPAPNQNEPRVVDEPVPSTQATQSDVVVPEVEVTSTTIREPSALDAGEGAIFGDTEGAPRVVVRALGDSWVQVRDGSGRTVFSRILRTGDIYRVPVDANLSMIAGSIGDLEFWVDGTPLNSLGDKGRVRRDIPLDAGSLKTLSPGR